MDLDLHQLRALSAAVSEGTFEAAAQRLHVTPSAISQRIKALETAAGRVLLVRSKPIRVTPSGRPVLRLARQLELLAADTAAELGAGDDEAALPRVAVAVNADSLSTWVLPALAPLADAMELRLVRGDEGRTSELLREGAVVAAVTAEAEPVAGCVVVPLGSMRYRPACTPAFAERWFPDGPTADALARAPVVSFDPDDPLQLGYIARHAHPGAAPPTHMIPSSIDHVAAIRLGVGWGMLADLLAGDEHAGAPLVDLDPDGVVDIPLYWQHWRLRSPSLETLTRIMVAAARGSLRG